MVDKNKPKVNKPKVNSVKESKVKESKAELFVRLGTLRVKKVLKAYRILGNCSNRHTYEYSKEQIAKIFEKLHLALEILQNKFTASKLEQESFEL